LKLGLINISVLVYWIHCVLLFEWLSINSFYWLLDCFWV